MAAAPATVAPTGPLGLPKGKVMTFVRHAARIKGIKVLTFAGAKAYAEEFKDTTNTIVTLLTIGVGNQFIARKAVELKPSILEEWLNEPLKDPQTPKGINMLILQQLVRETGKLPTEHELKKKEQEIKDKTPDFIVGELMKAMASLLSDFLDKADDTGGTLLKALFEEEFDSSEM